MQTETSRESSHLLIYSLDGCSCLGLCWAPVGSWRSWARTPVPFPTGVVGTQLLDASLWPARVCVSGWVESGGRGRDWHLKCEAKCLPVPCRTLLDMKDVQDRK